MKFVIAMIIIIGLSVGGYNFYQYWLKFKDKTSDTIAVNVPAAPPIDGSQLPGLPQKLDEPYNAAKNRGANGLRDFLNAYGGQIDDPRKAWIQLDYIELLSQSSPGEARQKFHDVESRITQDSPVYPRVKQLEKTYQ
jgi:hypothetical protein